MTWVTGRAELLESFYDPDPCAFDGDGTAIYALEEYVIERSKNMLDEGEELGRNLPTGARWDRAYTGTEWHYALAAAAAAASSAPR